MTKSTGVMKSEVFLESSVDTPLVWLSVVTKTGSAADPARREGFYRHAFELARRGTSERDRASFDETLDRMGASLDAFVARDYAGFSGLCLSKDFDELILLATELLASPAFSDSEHERLVRENLHLLDDLRDDDADVALRFFTREVAPGYPYSRTTLGTSDSLASLTASGARAAFESATAADNLVVGLAGDIDAESANRAADRLMSAVASSADHPEVDLSTPKASGPRILIVDKPGRTQSQIVAGHLGPAYGSDDYAALLPVETTFGGMFTSRMMQEIRVKRGWSYGAYCRLGKARGHYWLRMTMAPSLAQTAPAIELLLDMYRQLAADGITADELSFAKRYLSGQTSFQLATAHRRLSVAMETALFGSPPGFATSLPERIRAMHGDEVHRAASAWIRPDELCIVVVADASAVSKELEALGVPITGVVAHDSY